LNDKSPLENNWYGLRKALPIIDEWSRNNNPDTRRTVTEGRRTVSCAAPICQWNVFLPPELSGRGCNDRLAAHAIDHCCYHKYTYP